ncbi:type 4a pilus biogenesis protein PilO [bacterium]|jgi:Tfp pilus assembly protein PilO|nr:type 4a pilus biogenesis protein PilO [bacterium]MBT4121592.1 type 4a pilus biogenesis protein PilO [bacterium]MBT4335096.1 type 4a pilus biogenesis protein PilO [bacterium]MBT4764090.1 type 4a pilus biogenesis protein PilO [bacterium]MBT5401462.1 type 4a pilus biogenesis protein PilO [bacterium]
MKLNTGQITKYLIQLVILTIVLLFFIFPYSSNLNTVHNQFKSEASQLEIKFKTGEDFNQLAMQYDELNEKIPTLEEILLSEGQELELIEQLETIAEKYNLEQTLTLDLQKDEFRPNIIRIPFNFKIDGDFDDLLKYLSEISSINYNLTIQNINIRQNNTSLSADILGYTYWLTI